MASKTSTVHHRRWHSQAHQIKPIAPEEQRKALENDKTHGDSHLSRLSEVEGCPANAPLPDPRRLHVSLEPNIA